MGEWRLRECDLKRYPHFDPAISAADAVAYATDPNRVANHAFFPFMRYVQRWTRFAPKGSTGKPKERQLRYAARRDAYIFAYYRHLLAGPYEVELAKWNLESNILAYRRISATSGRGGKCNINFAYDAFLKIRELGTCCVVALDISSFFESLDHNILKKLWCRMIGKSRLPDDHFKVFDAITRYAVVDKERVYERLGHYGPKRRTNNGRIISGYLTPYKDVPKQLCTGREFRTKIAGGSGGSIIEKNYKAYGIPQGAPISDLLANLYLLDFDVEVNEMVQGCGGTYFRYSDDILLIIPGGAAVAVEIEAHVRDLITKFGPKLLIKEEKSSIVWYVPDGTGQKCKLISGDGGCRDGVEYLGFRYSGKRIYIRNRTLQNLYRKVTRSARREASALARRFPNRGATELKAQYNYEIFISRFGRVEEFSERQRDYRSWTFWSYSQRAASEFGLMGQPVRRQLRRLRAIVRAKMEAEIDRAVMRRDDPNRPKTKRLV